METQVFNSGADKSYQLAAALGATQAPLAALRENQVAKVQQDAIAWANGTSTADLNSAISNKTLLPSESPVFVAAVRNIQGGRQLAETVSDLKSKLATGELKFDSSKDFNDHFIKVRNEFLAGKDNFTVAGYDKAFNESRAALGELVRTTNDQTAINNAAEEGNAAMTSYLAYVSDPKQFQGTPAEGAQLLGDVYDTMVKNNVVAKEEGKKILTGAMRSLIPGGNKDLLDAMLDTRTSDGHRVRDIVGAEHSALFSAQASGNFDQQQVKNWVDLSKEFAFSAVDGQLTGNKLKRFEELWSRFEKYLPASSKLQILNSQQSAMASIQKGISAQTFANVLAVNKANNDSQIFAAIEAGNFGLFKASTALSVVSKDGTYTPVSDADQNATAQRYLQEKLQGVDPVTRASHFDNNGMVDEQAQASLAKLSVDLAEVTIGTNGKEQGKVAEGTAEGLMQFKSMLDHNYAYAKRVVGDSDSFDRLVLASSQLEMGRSIDEVAIGMARIKGLGITSPQYQGFNKSVQVAVDDLLDPDFLDKVASILPFFEGTNDMSNVLHFSSVIRDYAMFNVVTGSSANAKEAVAGALEHIEKNSVRVGNFKYLKKDLPEIPSTVKDTRTPAEWMDRYIKEVVFPIATTAGYNTDKVRLEKSPGGYVVYIGGSTFMQGSDGREVRIGNKQMGEWALQTTQTSMRSDAFDKHVIQEEARLIRKMPKAVQGVGRERLYGADVNPYTSSIIDRNKQLIMDKGWDQLPLDEMLANVRAERTKNMKGK